MLLLLLLLSASACNVKARNLDRLRATSDTTTTTISDGSPQLSLTSLTGGQVIAGGSSQAITWTATDTDFGATPISIEVSSDGGSTWSSLSASEANDGSYTWAVPAVDSATYRIRVIATDISGNSTTSASSSNFIIDNTAPSLSLTSLTGGQYVSGGSSRAITWTASDTNFGSTPIAIEVSSNSGTGWSSVSATEANDGTYSWTVPSVDSATYRIRLTATDAAGKTTVVSSTSDFTIDNTSPAITLTSLTGGQALTAGASQAVTWTASDTNFGATPILIEASSNGGSTWSTVASSEANDGTYSWTLPSVDDSDYRVRVTATDLAGRTTTSASSSDFAIDNSVPRVDSITVTESDPVGLRYIRVNLNASDDATKIKQFCVRHTSSSQPAASDSCWRAVDATPPDVTPAKSISISNFYITLGFAPTTYTIYGWVKDEVGRISTASASVSRQYSPTTPPEITDTVAASTDSPSTPPTQVQLTAASGTTVYIKWKLTDDRALPATPVTLYYTTDETNFTQIATNLINGVNGSCTVSAPHTGCYAWSNGSPANTYFRIRVAAVDSNSMVTYAGATPLNVADRFNFIAGNTDPGLGASASSAVFFAERMNSPFAPAGGTLAVAENGVVYFNDVKRGILRIAPSDGKQVLWIPTTGAQSGDGGSISGATLRKPFKIALDPQDRLLIFDYDRIRRVNTDQTPVTIETLIGGGSIYATDGISPLDQQIDPPADFYDAAGMPLFALPNGDIYFQARYYQGTPNAGMRIRVYHASNNQITSIIPSGTGYSLNGATNIGTLSALNFGVKFDPATSAITYMTLGLGQGHAQLNPATGASLAPHPPDYPGWDPSAYAIVGRDGNLYHYNQGAGQADKFNSSTNNWDRVLGTGQIGDCADGTAATSCMIDLSDFFVSSQGQMFFLSRGRIRTVDESGNVVSLYGQSLAFGDSGTALSARFNYIGNIAQTDSGNIIALDSSEYRFREFSRGSTISTIAGAGYSSSSSGTANPATTYGLFVTGYGQNWDRFSIDPTNGDVFFQRGNYRLGRLSRSTGKWQDIAGFGGTDYWNADGMTGSNVSFPKYPPGALGYDGTRVLVANSDDPAAAGGETAMLKFYDTTDSGRQSHLAGVTGAGPGYWALCADGSTLSTCGMTGSPGFGTFFYDSLGTRWLFNAKDDTRVRTMVTGGTIGTLATLAAAPTAFAYHRNAGLTTNIIYYCRASDGVLVKKDLVAATETALTWTVPGLQCRSRSLIYDSGRNSLIFPYTQNSLHGVVEYLLP